MEITTNKFLTKIHNDFTGDRMMPTKYIREIFGTDDLKEIIANSTIAGDLTALFKNNEAFDLTVINGIRCDTNKILEAIDLPYEVFQSVISSASKRVSPRHIDFPVTEYPSAIRRIINFLTCDNYGRSYNVHKGNLLDFFIVLTRPISRIRNVGNTECINCCVPPPKIPVESEDFSEGALMRNIRDDVDIINEVLRQLCFYHNGEKLYLNTVTISDFIHSFRTFKICQQENPLSNKTIKKEEVIRHMLHSKQDTPQNSGVMTLYNKNGERVLVQMRDLVPLPLKVAMDQIGQYGSVQRVKMSLRTTN